MALADPYQANDFPGDLFSQHTLHQPRNHAPQNPWVLPAPANDQPEGVWEDIPRPATSVPGSGRVQALRDMAYQDYHPQSLNPEHVFPDAGLSLCIPAQAQPNTPVNPSLECNSIGYLPPPDPAQTAFSHPIVHRIPTPNQGGAENLRRLASRYLHHPDARVGMVSMEAGSAGRFKVVIILESHDVF